MDFDQYIYRKGSREPLKSIESNTDSDYIESPQQSLKLLNHQNSKNKKFQNNILLNLSNNTNNLSPISISSGTDDSPNHIRKSLSRKKKNNYNKNNNEKYNKKNEKYEKNEKKRKGSPNISKNGNDFLYEEDFQFDDSYISNDDNDDDDGSSFIDEGSVYEEESFDENDISLYEEEDGIDLSDEDDSFFNEINNKNKNKNNKNKNKNKNNNKNKKKKRIINDSDDDEESFEFDVSYDIDFNDDTDDGWLDTKVFKKSEFKNKKNNKKKSFSKIIENDKNELIYIYSDDDHEDDEFYDDWFEQKRRKKNKKTNNYNNNNNNNNNNNQKNNQKNKKQKKTKTKTKTKTKKIKTINDDIYSDDDDELINSRVYDDLSDDDDDQYNDDEFSIDDKLKSLLNNCKNISNNLKNIISGWSPSNLDTDIDSCINLTDISTNDDENLNNNNNENNYIITNDLISSICPNLILKPYQLIGVNWMYLLKRNNLNGILADEMGLGKTIQTIAFLSFIKACALQRSNLPISNNLTINYNLPEINSWSLNPKSSTSTAPLNLIIVPSSTLDNWEREFNTWAPNLIILKYRGNENERAELRNNIFGVIKGKEPLDVILTTYSYWERESAQDDRNFFRRLDIHYLIMDEAHGIKNKKSSRYRRLCHQPKKYSILLTGTPVQNNLEELITLLIFLMPDLFGFFDEDISINYLNDLLQLSESDIHNAKNEIKKIRDMLSPFILRRLKTNVLSQLPPKKTEILKIDLINIQKLVYNNILKDNLLKKTNNNNNNNNNNETKELRELSVASSLLKPSAARINELILKNKNENNDIELKNEIKNFLKSHDKNTFNKKETKNIFSTLRRAANHHLLVRTQFNDNEILWNIATFLHSVKYYGGECTINRIFEELIKLSDFDLHCICGEFPKTLGKYQLSNDILFSSGKLLKLKELLPELIKNNHRILLFSQWTMILDILQLFLYEHLNISFLRLDGSTNVEERQSLVDNFNNNEEIKVFLLSTRAGGLGLNLTSADTVILHDPDFNPEIDRQAEDRCHRIGQLKDVKIIKLISQNTVDELIYNVAEKKSLINKEVLLDKKNKKKKDGETIADILFESLKILADENNNNDS